MLELGSWLKIGEREGTIQAWGVEVGFSPNSKAHPIKRASRKKAYASGMPMVLIGFHFADYEWWPLAACQAIPAPMFEQHVEWISVKSNSSKQENEPTYHLHQPVLMRAGTRIAIGRLKRDIEGVVIRVDSAVDDKNKPTHPIYCVEFSLTGDKRPRQTWKRGSELELPADYFE